jgi:hypothetical protein
MAWTALGMMIVSTVAVLQTPPGWLEADAVLMMMYGSLSAVVGAYFGFSQPRSPSHQLSTEDDY